MNATVKQHLIDYVVNQRTTPEIILAIKNFCQVQTPLSIILFRGHKQHQETILPGSWVSASLSEHIARNEFADERCCVFKIHLINVPCIDVNHYVGDDIGTHYDEQEYIFLGGGKFYKQPDLTEPGFLNLGNGNFECWYSIDEPVGEAKEVNPIDKINRIFEQISGDEYELISSPSDIVGFNLSPEEQLLVYNKIKQASDKTGGQIKRKHILKSKSKRQRKSKSKRTNKHKRRY